MFGSASQAQISVRIGTPPACPYGYYEYPPYACAPVGFYGPGYFYNGIFLGVGPWANWGYAHGWGGHRFAGGGGGRYVPGRYHGPAGRGGRGGVAGRPAMGHGGRGRPGGPGHGNPGAAMHGPSGHPGGAGHGNPGAAMHGGGGGHTEAHGGGGGHAESHGGGGHGGGGDRH